MKFKKKIPPATSASQGAAPKAGSGGVPPESLDAVIDFADEIEGDSVDRDDRRLHTSHPLALLVRNVLEAVSASELGITVAGLTQKTKERLATARHKLEKQKKRDAFQRLLFSFERLCDVVRDVGYGSEGEEESREFFTDAFPDWLVRLGEWAEEEGKAPLEKACDRAILRYEDIADDIVKDDDDE